MGKIENSNESKGIIAKQTIVGSYELIVYGKNHDATFSFDKKKASEMVEDLERALYYKGDAHIWFRRSQSDCNIRGELYLNNVLNSMLENTPPSGESYRVVVTDENNTVLDESGFSRKDIQHMIKAMKKVYEIK
jgi:hypothetical protein